MKYSSPVGTTQNYIYNTFALFWALADVWSKSLAVKMISSSFLFTYYLLVRCRFFNVFAGKHCLIHRSYQFVERSYSALADVWSKSLAVEMISSSFLFTYYLLVRCRFFNVFASKHCLKNRCNKKKKAVAFFFLLLIVYFTIS